MEKGNFTNLPANPIPQLDPQSELINFIPLIENDGLEFFLFIASFKRHLNVKNYKLNLSKNILNIFFSSFKSIIRNTYENLERV